MVVSQYNTQITLDLLQKKRENQYFERKGLGEKDISPTKIANQLIGMLNADGGVLAFGVSNSGDIQDINTLGEKLSDYRNLFLDFIEPHGNIKLEEVQINGNLIFLYHVDQDIERILKERTMNKSSYHNQATINDLVVVTGIHEKNVRLYLNQFIENEKILCRLSDKQRDKNAKYAFRKL